MDSNKKIMRLHNKLNSTQSGCVVRKSKIQGVGVFTTITVRRNQIVLIVADTHILMSKLMIKFHALPSFRKESEDIEWMTKLGKKVNHQKNANCRIDFSENKYWFVLVAIKPIKAGEELTVNYSTLEFPFSNEINGYKELKK